MPIYSFRADDGEVIEQFFRMAEAPRIGDTISVDGREFRRIADCLVSTCTDSLRVHPKYPYASAALPRQQWWSKKEIAATGTKFDRTGKPIVRTPRHEASVATAFNCEKM